MKTVLFVVFGALVAVQAVEFQFRNNEPGEVWVGIQGNPQKENLANGGFKLRQGEEVTLQAANDWAGRFWGRTWCNADTGHCETGDCGNTVECEGRGGTPPVSLAEITLAGWGGLDYYDISLVDGYNMKIGMEPIDGHGLVDADYKCEPCRCTYEGLNNECPEELRLYGSSGAVIGCKSACLAFDTDEYCCRGEHGTPDKCKASDWDINYPAFFKTRCPDAYSYAYDDEKSTFTCVAQKYLITFG